jgi:hypothetical protein
MSEGRSALPFVPCIFNGIVPSCIVCGGLIKYLTPMRRRISSAYSPGLSKVCTRTFQRRALQELGKFLFSVTPHCSK